MKRLLWAVWWATFAGVCVIAALTLWAAYARPVQTRFGNTNLPEKQPAKTRIAVFGDTQKGLAAFAALGAIAKSQQIDLAVHTGDLVSHADAGHFDLATLWVQRMALDVPFVVVPGNHDIKGGEGLFEKRIGPRQFAFRWGPVEIVVVDNAVAPPGEAAVERLLAAAKGPILLFMHVPPNDTTKSTWVAKSTYNCFLEMIRKYPVKYVSSGHAHGYTRIEDGGIVFIANGVGGDSDSWQFDQMAHLTIVESDGKAFRESAIIIQPVMGIRSNVEHLAIGHVGEIMLRRIWGIPAFVLLAAFLVFLYRKLRKKKSPPLPPPLELPDKRTPVHIIEPPDVVI